MLQAGTSRANENALGRVFLCLHCSAYYGIPCKVVLQPLDRVDSLPSPCVWGVKAGLTTGDQHATLG